MQAAQKSVYPRWRWGTHRLMPHQALQYRFIPAGAGNSNSYTDKSSKQTVYPRWRGKLPLRLMNDNKNGGLSPLARGTHILIGIHELRPRFIPAGAGNSATRWQSSYPTTVYPRWRGELFFQLQHCCCIDGLSPLARGTL